MPVQCLLRFIWYWPHRPSLLTLQYSAHIASLFKGAWRSACKHNPHGELTQSGSLLSFIFVPTSFLFYWNAALEWWAAGWSQREMELFLLPGPCPVSLGEGNVPGGWAATSGAQSQHPAGTAAHLYSAVLEVSQQCHGTAVGTPWHQQCPQLLQEGEELKFWRKGNVLICLSHHKPSKFNLYDYFVQSVAQFLYMTSRF